MSTPWLLDGLIPTIDVDGLPGDVCRIVRGEKADDGGDICAGAVPAERNTGADLLHGLLERQARRRSAAAQGGPMHLGGHIAWADAIDANAVRTELTGQCVREGDHPCLGGSVNARPGGGVTTEDGADRHDAARSGGNHGSGSRAATEEGAVEVDADSLTIRLIAHLGDRAATADTGVGH